MTTNKIATMLGIGSAILMVSTVSHAAHPKWSLTCDSESACIYLSDGNGSTGGYPVALDMATLQISVNSKGEEKCVWQWKLIGGTWRWVCVLSDGGPQAK